MAKETVNNDGHICHCMIGVPYVPSLFQSSGSLLKLIIGFK